MQDPAAGLGLDQRALDTLRTQAAQNPKAAARQAAVQFESLFTQMVLKSMRDATPKASDAGGGETFTAMLDTQFAKQFAGRPNGLADVIEKQLSRHMQNLPAAEPQGPVIPADLSAPSTVNLPAVTSSPAKSAPAAPAASIAPAPAAVRPSTARTPAANRAAEFIQKMLPHAKEAERQTGVPASFILGQAALESGWGKAEVRNPDGSTSFNLFGIKATRDWKGASTKVATTEYEGGQAVRQRAAFRSYGSYAEAFADYAKLLSAHPRYGNVVRNASTAEAFAGGMQRAGYATDPAYATKLARVINTTLALQRTMA